MKKGLLGAIIFSLFTWSAFCGTFTDLGNMVNSVGGSKTVDVVESPIPDGRSLLPIVYRYTHDKVIKDEKILDTDSKFIKVNVINDTYDILTKLFFKAGIGVQCQEAEIIVKKVEGNYSVTTVTICTYAVDKNGKQNGDVIEGTAKKKNNFTKNVVSTLDELFKCSDDEYKHWEEMANADMGIQASVEKAPQNKIQKKRWYEEHFPVGKEIELNFYFVTIVESSKKGFAYELKGLLADSPETVVHFYTNKEEYVDKAEKTAFKIKGTITKVVYSPDTSPKFKMESIIIEE
ncbi:MAG: hypothetical protein MJZ50_09795 [Treponema sp.]|nr:hypothetical protein [Treponema sp.]